MPGSATGYAATMRASELDRLIPGTTERFDNFAVAVRNTASNVEATDSEFSTYLGFVGLHPR